MRFIPANERQAAHRFKDDPNPFANDLIGPTA